jgi:hypothetical protein
MIAEVLIICITVYLIVAPIAYAKSREIRKRTQRIESRNADVDCSDIHINIVSPTK